MDEESRMRGTYPGRRPRYRIAPLSETFTLPVALSKLPLNMRRPRAPANVPVPSVTVAVPEKETLLPPPTAHGQYAPPAGASLSCLSAPPYR